MWGTKTPTEAKAIIEKQKKEIDHEPLNLEEQAISLVGRDIYEKLIKGYTEKQWSHECKDLPSFIIKRIPVRFTFDNNYFNDKYQGIPENGYTEMIINMLKGIEVHLNADYYDNKEKYDSMASKIIFTGAIDEYYDYCYGSLEWRSLNFETEILDIENYQGVAAVNYTDRETPYTRILEHKHFGNKVSDKTVITREYPKTWSFGDEPYYPVNDEKNSNLYQKYKELAVKDEKVVFGGRLGQYKYFDMDKDIEAALEMVRSL
jgi:UDP-galactopyranose mutase